MDILLSEGWWENPSPNGEGATWVHHPFDLGPEGMEMYAYDVDSDGLNNVVTAIDATVGGLHGFGNFAQNAGSISKKTFYGASMKGIPYGDAFRCPTH